MSTTSTGSPALQLTTADRGRLRRSGWLMIGSFIGFVLFVATLIATGNSGYDAAVAAAAKQRGVEVNDLTAEALAPINHQYNGIWSGILPLLVVLAALCAYVVGVHLATKGSGAVGRTAVVIAALMPVCWLGVFLLEFGIGTDNPGGWIDAYDAVYDKLIALSSVAGTLALFAVILVMRRAGVARRTGVVIGLLGVLVLVAAIGFGAPPIVPLLLAAIIGIVMITTARSAKVA
jgi:uncharacterized membrane protein YozB (DUF420 family)